MAFEQPQSRNEAILQNMLGAENELVPPQSRIEALLQAILLQGVPDGAVTTDKLADGAVTYDKLAEALKNQIDGKADKSDAVFNIRGYIDYDEHPYLYLWFSRYINGNLIEQPLTEDVFNITNSSVYLYRNTSNQWTLGFTSPSSGTYNGTPMLIGKIVTKTVNGALKKYFVRNDEENLFDDLNENKVDKETWELIDTVTIEEEVSEIKKNVDSDGNALKLKAIKILASLESSSTSTAELLINAYSDNNYNSTVGSCVERLALPDAKINYVAEQQNGYWNAEWSGRRATTNYKGGYFLTPAFSTLSVTSKPYIRSWKVKTPTSGVTFSTSTTIEIWGIRGE